MSKFNKLSMLFVIFLLGLSVELSYAKPITLIYSEFRPESMGACQLAKWWGQELEKRTGGRLRVRYFWSSSLVPAYDQMKAIGEGVAHAGMYLAGFNPAGAPLFNITMLVPPITDNGYAVAMATRRLAELPEAKAELEKNNVKYLSPDGTLGDFLHTKKPVTKLADLQGLKIRSWGPFAQMLKLWGATPVMMPPVEVYTALERGVVDGNNQSMTLIWSSRNYEHAKHFLMFNMGLNAGAPTVMNLDMWKSLPRDIQKIVEEVSSEYTERWVKQWEQEENEAIAKMKADGCEFHEIGPELKKELFEKSKSVLDLQAQILDKQGLPGKKIQETYFSYIREYEKKGKK